VLSTAEKGGFSICVFKNINTTFGLTAKKEFLWAKPCKNKKIARMFKNINR
jgi:hypothetical protein